MRDLRQQRRPCQDSISPDTMASRPNKLCSLSRCFFRKVGASPRGTPALWPPRAWIARLAGLGDTQSHLARLVSSWQRLVRSTQAEKTDRGATATCSRDRRSRHIRYSGKYPLCCSHTKLCYMSVLRYRESKFPREGLAKFGHLFSAEHSGSLSDRLRLSPLV